MLDAKNIFDGTLPNTPVAITSTRVSTNVIDLLSARDIGVGNDIEVVVDILTTFTTTNSATLQFQIETCSTAGGSYIPLLLSPVMAAANLVAGRKEIFVLPRNQFNNLSAGIVQPPGEFLRLTYTVGTGAFTAGAVFSYLNAAPDKNQFYAYKSNYLAGTTAAEL